jgi:hypothetical protein
MSDHVNRDELHALTEAAIEGRLTPEQAARLEHLVLAADPAARRFYAEYARLHAALQWADPPLTRPAAEPAALPRRRDRRGLLAALAALAAAILLGLFVWPRELKTVATLTDTKACKWDAGTLPTETGASLTPGRLRLAEGLARLTFASGAVVTLEGPADLELVSPMRCALHRGQLVASVPPAATGFVVDTPGTRVTDYGTEFGVTVHPEQTADVQVFSGRVDVLHHPTGRTEEMRTGGLRRFTPDGPRPFDPNRDVPSEPAVRPAAGTRIVHLSTAQGRGRDAFVMPIEIPPDRRSDTLLLVKNTVPKHADWYRKAYMTLDLTGVDVAAVREAELAVTFAPTGMGFASQIGDATFTVYGLTDEDQDDWDETTVRWATAPANRPGGTAVDPDRAVRLGSFVLPQGEQTGVQVVGGPAVAEFLRADTNRLVTFVLVRDTAGTGASELVHGVASRRHPTLAPPTLRLTLTDRR